MKNWRLILLFTVIPILVFSQENDSLSIDLPQLTLTKFLVEEEILQAPMSISVLDEQIILSNNASDVSLIVNQSSGVFMQSGSINTNRISIRGMGARTPYGTNKIRGFYGNIPLTSGDSETTIEDLDLEQISQIEIIKGPMSSIYGAGLGGAIILQPISTKKNVISWQFGTTVGSFELLKNNAHFAWEGEKSSIQYAYSRIQLDGFRENSNYFREGHTLSGNLFQNEKHQLRYLFNQTYLKSYIPSSINQTDFEENPHLAAANWREAKGFEQYHNWMLGLDYSWKLNSNFTLNSAIYGATKDAYEPRPFDILDQSTQSLGGRFSLQGNQFLNFPIQLNIGAEYFYDQYEGETFENLYASNNGGGSLQGNPLVKTNQDRSFIQFFAQFKIPIFEKWFVQAELNYNQTQLEFQSGPSSEIRENSKKKYDPIFSPQLSLLFHPNRFQSAYFSYSRGYSFPSIEEILDETGRLNPEIRPEIGDNFELGYKIARPKWQLELAIYQMNVKNLLVSDRVAEDQYVGVNAGETLHQGIEIAGNYRFRLGQNWTFIPRFAASIGRYEFKEFLHNDENFSGNQLTGVPANLVSSGFRLEMPFGFSWTGDYQFVDQFPINDANTLFNESYQLIHSKLNWENEFLDKIFVGLSFGVNNLTDTKYSSMVLVNATAFGNALPRYYYPGNPRNFYGQIRLKFSL